jgi:DME family drug/metabolite transporter
MTGSSPRGRLLVVAAAALFSTGGAAIKAASLSGWQIAALRSGVAALFFLLMIPEARRGWRWRMLPVALCYAATLDFFVLGNRLTTAANTIFLQSAAPLYVLLLGPILLHELVRRRDVIFVVAVACGIACIFAGSPKPGVTAPDPWRGNLFGVASGVTDALMIIGFRWLARKEVAGAVIGTVALGNVIACLAALPLALPIQSLAAADVAVLLYLGTVQIGVAYLCLSYGISHVPAVQAAALLMVEPALNPVWTWLVHGEKPGPWGIAGGMLILSATLWNVASTRSPGAQPATQCALVVGHALACPAT